MKKKILSILLLAATNIAFAQFRLGVQGALGVANPSVDGLAKDIKDKKWTLSGGLVLDFRLGGALNFRPSVNYQTNDYTLANVTPGSLSTLPSLPAVNTVNYVTKNVSIPLDLIIPVKVGKNSKLLVAVGPVVTVALSGEYTIVSTSGSIPTGITYGNTGASIKNVDWGSNFGLGLRLGKKLDIMSKYKYGFTNQSNQANNSLKQHSISLTGSYFLFGK